MCRRRLFLLFSPCAGLGLRVGGSSLAFVLACGILFDRTAARGATPRAFPGALALHEGKLTARLSAAPLQQVMEEIGDLSGVEIVWLQQGKAGTVSVDFSNVPLTRALRLILGEKNFLLFYSSAHNEAHLFQIWIFSGGGAQATTPTSATVALFRQWHRTALRGAPVHRQVQAVEHLKP